MGWSPTPPTFWGHCIKDSRYFRHIQIQAKLRHLRKNLELGQRLPTPTAQREWQRSAGACSAKDCSRFHCWASQQPAQLPQNHAGFTSEGFGLHVLAFTDTSHFSKSHIGWSLGSIPAASPWRWTTYARGQLRPLVLTPAGIWVLRATLPAVHSHATNLTFISSLHSHVRAHLKTLQSQKYTLEPRSPQLLAGLGSGPVSSDWPIYLSWLIAIFCSCAPAYHELSYCHWPPLLCAHLLWTCSHRQAPQQLRPSLLLVCLQLVLVPAAGCPLASTCLYSQLLQIYRNMQPAPAVECMYITHSDPHHFLPWSLATWPWGISEDSYSLCNHCRPPWSTCQGSCSGWCYEAQQSKQMIHNICLALIQSFLAHTPLVPWITRSGAIACYSVPTRTGEGLYQSQTIRSGRNDYFL